MKVLILGASPSPDRYSYKALELLVKNNHQVIAVGNHNALVNNIEIKKFSEEIDFNGIHTVTLYINPQIQKSYYDLILNKIKPKRIIFNPGTENIELKKMAKNANIEVVEGCTIVMLLSGQF